MTAAHQGHRLRPITAHEYPAMIAATRAGYAHDIGGNDAARGLYRSLGYVETSVQMGKDLPTG